MPGKQAKILSSFDVGDLLVFAGCTRHPLRNTVMVLLSAKAGLRAGEIANLTWHMVLDANGQISGVIELADSQPKNAAAGPFRFTLSSWPLLLRGGRLRRPLIMWLRQNAVAR
jgi:integrase